MISTADYLIKRLNELKITEIFGLPGDFNFQIVEAIEKNKNVNWIGSTNELNAAYAADGYARIKGYGAMVSTFGVGELSAINALAGCMAENVPVVKIVGVPSTHHIKNKTLLHHNLQSANYYAFCDAYKNVVETTAFLTHQNAKSEINRALNTLIKTKRPVYIAIPMDVALAPIEDKYEPVLPKTDKKVLDKVVEIIKNEIKKAKNPCVLADVLAKRFDAKAELNSFLEKTKIPSVAFIRGMDVIKTNTKNYLGTYSGRDNFINTSDCIIAFGAVVSDLNTFNFDIDFDINEHINIQSDYVIIRGQKFKNVLIKDLLSALVKKVDYVSSLNLERTFKYDPVKAKNEPLTSDYIYPKLQEFMRDDDILITEVGLAPLGSTKMVLPNKIDVLNQMMWGSIGWATPCAEGAAFSSRRTILITGDGSHQLTAQEISTMMRNNLKPIIFVLNNSGYTVERLLCDDVHYKYNDIAVWNYSKLPCVFQGECFSAVVKTDKEFDEILKKVEIEQKKKMCYIELKLDYLDIPKLALKTAKHPKNFIAK